VHEVGGIPAVIRTDRGTENVNMAALQELLRGDRHAHIYSTSPSNQRVEAWWYFFGMAMSSGGWICFHHLWMIIPFNQGMSSRPTVYDSAS